MGLGRAVALLVSTLKSALLSSRPPAKRGHNLSTSITHGEGIMY